MKLWLTYGRPIGGCAVTGRQTPAPGSGVSRFQSKG